MLWLCHKLTRTPRAKAILIACVLCASLWFSDSLVGHDVTADFYSPLTRAWELAVGALLAYRQQYPSRQWPWLSHSPHASYLLSATGLALLIVAFVLINQSRAFPGLWALLPTLGAACFIAAGMDSKLNQYVLGSRPLVWVGLISYPLYLWHWPLLTFARIFEGQTPSITVRATLLVASFFLAFLTYRLIERKVRFPASHASRDLHKSRIVVALCFVMLVLFAFGYAITRHDGFSWRHNDKLGADSHTIVLGADRDLLRHACGLPPRQAAAFEWCLSQNKNVAPQFAVIGDSKAEALYYGLARESDANQNWLLMGTFPAFSLNKNGTANVLEQAMQRLETDSNIQVVVLANSFRHIFSTDKETRFINKSYSAAEIEQLAVNQNEVVSSLQRAGKHVVFFIDNPTLPDPTSCIQGAMTSLPVLRHLLTRKANPYCQIRYTDHLAGTAAYQQFIRELQRINPKLMVFNPLPLLCDTANNVCTYFEDRNFLYGYGDHISDYANSKIAKQLLPLIRTLAKP
jgi:hypothetical protein